MPYKNADARREGYRRCQTDERRFFDSIRQHDVTVDQYHAKAESQDFLCGICHEEKVLEVDHDHATGKFRGLLCRPCNRGLGLFHDSTQKLSGAQAYLAQRASAVFVTEQR